MHSNLYKINIIILVILCIYTLYSSLDENENSKLRWYVCCVPTGAYNNLFTHQDAIRHRILFRQQYKREVEGFLYRNSIYCEKGNPRETSKTRDKYESAGDGCLIYTGKYMDTDEPVATLRLKNVADGMEDYAYLRLCEEIKGSEWVDQKISEITDSLTSCPQMMFYFRMRERNWQKPSVKPNNTFPFFNFPKHK